MARRESLRAEAARTGETLYAVRVRRGEELGFSPGQAVGHPRPGEGLVSATTVGAFPIYSNGRIVEVEVNRRDSSRAGRYLNLTSRLIEGAISPKDFQRQVGRMKPIGGVKPEADPRKILALHTATPPAARQVRYGRRSTPGVAA